MIEPEELHLLRAIHDLAPESRRTSGRREHRRHHPPPRSVENQTFLRKKTRGSAPATEIDAAAGRRSTLNVAAGRARISAQLDERLPREAEWGDGNERRGLDSNGATPWPITRFRIISEEWLSVAWDERVASLAAPRLVKKNRWQRQRASVPEKKGSKILTKGSPFAQPAIFDGD